MVTTETTATLSFGVLLKRLRRAARQTQEQLAERAGYSVSYISQLERGERLPLATTAVLLAEALHLTEDERASLESAARRAHSSPSSKSAWASAESAEATESAPRRGFPEPLTSLIGREHEEAAVSHLLRQDEIHLLTLIGPPGIGKTRLAIKVVAGLGTAFPDGVVFVPLAEIREPELVLPAIARTLEPREAGRQSIGETLRIALAEKRMLLVLDNCEQVVTAGPHIAAILAEAPGLKVLATSRVPLRLRGEQEFAVPPLTLPPEKLEDRPALAPEELSQYAAVALFVQRARAVKPAFALTPALAPSVVAICRRLDGIPLAIELAAARVKLLAPRVLLERIGRDLDMLSDGARDLPERQRTLRGAITWSHDLLPEAERTLLRRLSVFAGGWTLEAAEAICSGDNIESSAVPGLLTHLVDASFVVVAEQNEDMRYSLLETICLYARDQLIAADEESTLRSRHLDWFLRLAEESPGSMWSPFEQVWVRRLAPEYSNLRAALEWSGRDTSGDKKELRLAFALFPMWMGEGLLGEGRRALEAALARARNGKHTLAWARAYLILTQIAGLQHDLGLYAGQVAPLEECVVIMREAGDTRFLGVALLTLARAVLWEDTHRARTLFEESLAVFRAAGDTWGIAFAHFVYGEALVAMGEYDTARKLMEQSAALFRELGVREWVMNPLTALGRIACAEGKYEQARATLEEVLAFRRTIGDKRLTAVTLNSLGEVARCESDLIHAVALFDEALGLYQGLADQDGIAWSLHNLGQVALATNDLQRAADHISESLRIRLRQRDTANAATCLAGLGGVATSRGDSEQAVRLLAAADALLASVQCVLPPADQLVYERQMAALRLQLEDGPFERAWADGEARSLELAADPGGLRPRLPSDSDPQQRGAGPGGRGPAVL